MAASVMPKFFQAWETIPSWSAKPADGSLEQRITKLAEFAAKNGPPFVDMMRQKQAKNPQYSFLTGGAGSDYFRWRLYCGLYDLDAEHPLQLSDWQVAPHQFQEPLPASHAGQPPGKHDGLFASFAELRERASQLPEDVDSTFSAVLSTLNSTRASIKASKEWFMARANFATGLAAKMAVHQHGLPLYEQQICIIYLANDVLLKSLNQRPEASDTAGDPVAAAFRTALPLMLHTAFVSGNHSPEVLQRLMTILDHWSARSIYSTQTVEFMKQALVRGPESAISPQGPPIPAAQDTQQHAMPSNDRWPPAAATPQEQPWSSDPVGAQPLSHLFPQQPMHTHMAEMGWNAAPTGVPHFSPAAEFHGQMHPLPQASFPGMAPMGYMNQHPFIPPSQMHPESVPQPGVGAGPGIPPGLPPWPQTGAADSLPMPEPVDPMSFPPGLLPVLVKEQLRTEEQYHPLDKQDVINAGIPDPAALDAYLAARLEKFAAELRDYRPGSSRADLEGDEKRQKTRNNLGEKGPGRYGRSSPEEKPKYDDGSFQGEKRDGGPAGLGFGVTPDENADDPFNQYRKKRSGFYHSSLSRAQAAAAAKLQAVT